MKKKSNYLRDRLAQEPSLSSKARKYCFNKTKKIRIGDKVVVTAGNSVDQTGTVILCKGDRAVIQGVNMGKKHVKAQKMNPNGGIIDRERSIHISNLKVCDANGAPLKLKAKFAANGEKQLVSVNQDGQEVLHRSIKKS